MTGQTYDPAADPVHGSGWNSAARWGGWEWRAPRGAQHYRTCSFCGSIHPEDLAAEPAWRASWADRKYGWPHKFYAEGIANRHPQIKRIITACTQQQWDEAEQAKAAGYPEPWPGRGGYEWHPVGSIPPGTDISGWRLDDGRYSHVGLGSDTTHHAKFYTIHLADPAVSDEAKDAIQRVSGLWFKFTQDGHVSWAGIKSLLESDSAG